MALVHLDTVKRELRGIALALVLIGVTTLLAVGLVHYLGIRRGTTIYLLTVLICGWQLGLWPALVAAVAGVLGSAILFYNPNASPSELLDLALFLIVALVASHLENSMKHTTELARKRELEMTDLYAFSRRLAAAPGAAAKRAALSLAFSAKLGSSSSRATAPRTPMTPARFTSTAAIRRRSCRPTTPSFPPTRASNPSRPPCLRRVRSRSRPATGAPW